MAFNLSEVDLELYVAANTAVQARLLVVIVILNITLSIICTMAIIFTQVINWQMRVALVNIFVTDVVNLLGYMVDYLAFTLRALDKPNTIYSCRFFVSFLITAGMQKFAAITIYSIMVYVFLKYGVKKLKWYMIVPSLVITWIVSISVGILPFFDQFELFNNNGFCRNLTSTSLYYVVIGSFLSSAVIGSCIIVFFSIISYRVLKKNTLDGNVEVKRAVSKNFFYLAVAAVFATISQIFPSFSPLIRSILLDYRYFIAWNFSFK